MLGPCGNGDPVVGFAEHLQHLVTDVQAKQTLAFHEETHFVFGVNVLAQELGPEGCLVGMLGGHADGIHRGVVA